MSTNFQFAHVINPGAGSEASPRSSAPPATRVFQVPVDPSDPRRGSGVVLALDDGTSAAATLWVRDDATGTWYQVGGSVTALPGAVTDPVLLPSGADYFVRVGAVVGSPTKLRVGFIVGTSPALSAGGAPTASTVTANQGTAGAAGWLALLVDSTNTALKTAVKTVQTSAAQFLNSIGMAVYNATPPAPADGNLVPLQADAAGNLRTAEQYTVGAWSIVAKSTALEASRQVSTTAGKLRSLTVRIDSTASSGTLYVQVLDAAALPADGAVTHVVAPIKRIHVSGTDDYLSIDFSERGVAFGAGCFIVLSSSEFTKTIGGAFLSVTAVAAATAE
jgi:hypothetical protein